MCTAPPASLASLLKSQESGTVVGSRCVAVNLLSAACFFGRLQDRIIVRKEYQLFFTTAKVLEL